ncbi:hypothetical protein CL630_03085 [bacterium]|nr:hypothetical protein [bacterium]|tara:strand:+ start:63 stop:716 length:654 start_codon:yes stop_codon:yes gene_type:complete
MSIGQLKQSEFDTHVAGQTLRLSFVGMSNAGKSYRSKVLCCKLGFSWHHVDEKIQEMFNFHSMTDISSWLGHPSDTGYQEREKCYLRSEDQLTRRASIQTSGKNLVLDTTGSVVHLNAETLQVLYESCLVVHLDVGNDSLDCMIEQFFSNPKPVIWCGHFSMNAGESKEDALRRCYPILLKRRLERYRTLAHVNIPASSVRDLDGRETLNRIRECLG